MHEVRFDSHRFDARGRSVSDPFRPDFGDFERDRTCAVAMKSPDEIILTIGPPEDHLRYAARLTPSEARRVATDLLAFAGAVDGSLGD